MSTKATDFFSWLQNARDSYERFASKEEQEALNWIRRQMPSEPNYWDALAQAHAPIVIND